MKITVNGELSVHIATNLRSELLLSVVAKRSVSFSYCPQRAAIDIVEDIKGLRQLKLKYGAKVILENLELTSLKLTLLNSGSQAILRGNHLDELVLHSDSRNTVDMTMQGLPGKFSHQLGKDTVVRMPNQGPPTCIVCHENLCSACSSMNHCPVCRRESGQVRVYQQSVAHYC